MATVSGVFCPLLVVVSVWLEGAKAVICEDVSLDTQNVCRNTLGIGQYPTPYQSYCHLSLACLVRSTLYAERKTSEVNI